MPAKPRSSVELPGTTADLKPSSATREGAESGAIELKRRFPMLQIRIYDADTQTRQDFPDLALTVRP
jgi:hypothetical protein